MSIFIRVCLTIGVTFTALNCNADDLLVTVSPETTRITSPLKEDGYPDYVAALNAQFQKNTTPGRAGAPGRAGRRRAPAASGSLRVGG